MDQKIVFLTIAGMLAVTYLPRAIPVVALASRSLPEAVVRWLSYVPAAVLAAMLGPELLLANGRIDLSTDNVFLLASIPSLLVARLTNSFFGAVFTGIGCVALLRYLG